MPVARNLTKLFSHEAVEYSVGLALAWQGLLNVEGFLVYALAMQFVHLADFEIVDRTWARAAVLGQRIRGAL